MTERTAEVALGALFEDWRCILDFEDLQDTGLGVWAFPVLVSKLHMSIVRDKNTFPFSAG